MPPVLNCTPLSALSPLELDEVEDDDDADEEDPPVLPELDSELDAVAAAGAALPLALAVDVAVSAVVNAAQLSYCVLSAVANVTSKGPYSSPCSVWSLSWVSSSPGLDTGVSAYA